MAITTAVDFPVNNLNVYKDGFWSFIAGWQQVSIPHITLTAANIQSS
jgi:hypothetical protein